MARGLMRGFRDYVRANFIAGMFVALPLAITVAALVWVWEWLDGPLREIFGFTAGATSQAPWWRFLSAVKGTSHYEDLIVPSLGLFILLLAVLLLGTIIRSIIGRYILSGFEGMVGRVPLAGLLYTSIKQLGEAFVDAEGKGKFHSAVLVQFPMEGSWVIGFVTSTANESLTQAVRGPLKTEAAKQGLPEPDVVTVFVPTTPLPTQGFTLVLRRSETRPLDMSVQEAMKLVVSGGTLTKLSGMSGKLPPALVPPGAQTS